MGKKEIDEEKVECHYNGCTFFIPTRIFMEAVFLTHSGTKDFIRYKTGAQLFDVCERTFVDLAQEAGATHKRLGEGNNGTVFVDRDAISRYIRSLPSA